MYTIGIDEVGLAASKRRASPNSYTIGIDEVGRGALAGPVVVAAVALPRGFYPRSKDLPPLRDSKRLSHRQRVVWFNYLKESPNVFYASARVYQGPIDRINIARAANIAASRALDRVILNSDIDDFSILLDGSLYLGHKSHVDFPARTITRGDEKFISIRLASIVAKVTRDAYMTKLRAKYPAYGFEVHKGYGTKRHIAKIRKYGPSDAHRLTYIKS